MPNKIIATADIVRIHPDGGITTIARSGNSTQKWRKLKNGEDIAEAPKPKEPTGEHVGKFVRMGEIVVKRVNGRKNLTADHAGKTVETTSGYSVEIKENGFPDFTPYSEKNIEISNMAGNETDYAKANYEAFADVFTEHSIDVDSKQAKWVHKWAEDAIYKDYTWHHHEDTKTMQLVPSNLNNPKADGLIHTGGAAVVKHNLNNPNDPLILPSPDY